MRAFLLLVAFGASACGLDRAGLGVLPGEPGAGDEVGGDPGLSGSVPPPADVREAGPPKADGGLAGSPGADAGVIMPFLLPDATLAADGEVAREASSSDRAVASDAVEGDAGDGAPHPVVDAQASESSTTACVSSLPAGWTLAIYDLGTDRCPSTFPEHDVFGPPSISAGACSCDCTVVADGDCTEGTLTFSGSSGRGPMSTCGETVFSGPVSASSCTLLDMPFSLPATTSFQANPLSAGGGKCAGSGTTDPTALSKPSARYCDVPAADADSVCTGLVPSGFAACIISAGSVDCPASTMFQHPYAVEDDASLVCSGCGGCRVATDCSDATITAFPDVECLVPPVLTAPVDGNCDPGQQRPAPAVISFEYNVVATTTCTAASSTASARLTKPRTICCL